MLYALATLPCESLGFGVLLYLSLILSLDVQDATDLWNADTEQTAALFDSMVKKMEQNCLAENKLSAICCEGAKRDPELAMRVPAPPLPEAAPPKQSKAVSSKIDSIMAGWHPWLLDCNTSL